MSDSEIRGPRPVTVLYSVPYSSSSEVERGDKTPQWNPLDSRSACPWGHDGDSYSVLYIYKQASSNKPMDIGTSRHDPVY